MTDDEELDRITIRAARVNDQLRPLLRARFPFDPAAVLASALSYEVASLIASEAPDLATAIELVWTFADTQVDQIRRLGVGRPHP